MCTLSAPLCQSVHSIVCVILGLAIFVELRQTDRRTDGQIHDDSIYRASIASRGKNQNGCKVM